MYKGRVIEIRLIHIIFVSLFLVLSSLSYLSYIYFNDLFIYFLSSFIIYLKFLLVYLFVPNYYYFEISNFFKNNIKKSVVVLLFIVILSSLFIIPLNFSLNFSSINFNMDFNLFEKTKTPTLENPVNIETVKKENVGQNSKSTNEITTTSTSTTSTTSTTTTTSRTENDKRGFFFNRKETPDKDQPIDCTFDGKGHDAVLMPSGNYYCRSTQQRVSIYVDGVEKICCVTPY